MPIRINIQKLEIESWNSYNTVIELHGIIKTKYKSYDTRPLTTNLRALRINLINLH